MSREAPFLIDDLLPPGTRLLALNPVESRRIPLMPDVAALALPAGRAARPALAALARPGRAVVVVAAGVRACREAAAELAALRLPGLALALDPWREAEAAALARGLAARLGASAPQRYRAKMRELAGLIDPEAGPAAVEGAELPAALDWRARLHARALWRFLERQGRGLRVRRRVPEVLPRPAPDLVAEEVVLDRLIAEERARRATLFRLPLPRRPWRPLQAGGGQ